MIGRQLTVAAANSMTSSKHKINQERRVFIVIDDKDGIAKVKKGKRQGKDHPHRYLSTPETSNLVTVMQRRYASTTIMYCCLNDVHAPGFYRVSDASLRAGAMQHCFEHVVALVSFPFQTP